MTTSHEITAPLAALTFLLAGKATFTVVNEETGGRYTFRVRRVENDNRPDVHFVDVLSGPSNTSDFTRLGMIFDEKRFVVPSRWNVSKDAPSARAFAWVFVRLTRGMDLGPARFLHEGRCGRCNRTLTVPSSIDSGLGPVCQGLAA